MTWFYCRILSTRVVSPGLPPAKLPIALQRVRKKKPPSPRHSIQDQQNQIRDQRNHHQARYSKHEGFCRLATFKPFGLNDPVSFKH